MTATQPTKLPPHPLRVWREAQTVFDHKTKRNRPMRQADAARRFGCPQMSWAYWEKWPEEGGGVPNPDSLRKLFDFTNGKVTPNDFYRLENAA